MKKTVFTLNIGDYHPDITAMTYPLMRAYAKKIGADFEVMTIRRFHDWPIEYEKLSLYELGRGNDWIIYFDSDVLIHPDFIDVTEYVGKDTVIVYGYDLAGSRWPHDNYHRRDGRHISTGTWMAMTSDWCLDYWRPMDDLTPDEAVRLCHNVQVEKKIGMTPEHLVDDLALSRNVARFGLKLKTFKDLEREFGHGNWQYFFHRYDMNRERKVAAMREALEKWGVY